jgi:5-methylcytosine-specific restriction endonuclease McrA
VDATGYNRDGSPVNRTDAALIGRGIDRATATRLRQNNWTLSGLRSASDKALKKLKLKKIEIKKIRAGDRPEIPFDTLAAVIVANRFTCCVCRNPRKSIIVHHIREWSESHDHSAANLAVVCIDHHDRAHTKSELSRNLTPAVLRKFKRSWEDAVKVLDISAILTASRVNADAWLYFNHIRLFELARSLGVNPSQLPSHGPARRAGQVDSSGTLKRCSAAHGYMYEGGDGTTLYRYVRDVFEAILNRITVINISDLLDRGLLAAVVKPGDFVLVQGLHYFAGERRRMARNGPGQTATVTRSTNGVKIVFVIDRWEATSNSARTVWLRGGHAVASVLRIINATRDGRSMKVEASAIAIAHGLDDLKKREYSSAPFRRGVIFSQGDEDLGYDKDEFAGD